MDLMQPRSNPRHSELPLYLQNIQGQLAMTHKVGKTLLENQHATFLEPLSSIKLNSINKKQKTSVKKKKALTFN